MNLCDKYECLTLFQYLEKILYRDREREYNKVIVIFKKLKVIRQEMSEKDNIAPIKMTIEEKERLLTNNDQRRMPK